MKKSNCCNSEYSVYSGRDGTSYWVCMKCGHACDLK